MCGTLSLCLMKCAYDVQAIDYTPSGTVFVYYVNSSAFCYHDGYGSKDCYSLGNSNLGNSSVRNSRLGMLFHLVLSGKL